MPDMRELIRRKRNGAALSSDEIQWLVQGAVAGRIPDYQLSALLMACCFTRLSEAETLALTQAFVQSGDQLTWVGLSRPVVDKHSTGGVGDKVSLALAPWLSAAGLAVPKMSGRGLGHTGGTLDKLAAIPGFSTELDQAGMTRLLDSVGCCIAGQSANLVPADKLFYALRDATETVDELGLIIASILSKKLACGADVVVLDVKCGNGAFFRTMPEAQAFSELAERIGMAAGRKLRCVISAMDQPLGRTVGNALEVQEAAEMLSGRCESPELQATCLDLGSVALELALNVDPAAARARLTQLLDSGAAWEVFQSWIAAQGGDWAAFERDAANARAEYVRIDVPAPGAGRVTALDALGVGLLACDLGAGRRSKDDMIDPWVGIVCRAKVGDTVAFGETVAELVMRGGQAARMDELVARYLDALRIE